ncbi:MAG: biotin transporter BioY [Pseudomonadota bacterium]
MTRQDWLGALGFAVLITVGAKLSFELPGVSLPQTGQTLMVLLAGAVLGAGAGSVAVLLYIAAGVAGLEVFAGNRTGVAVLIGPSGGYLLGFWLAAMTLGWLRDRGWLARHWWAGLVGMLAGHAMIILIGAGLLVFSLGLSAAWFNGVQPFLPGALVKSILGAALLLPLSIGWRKLGRLLESTNGKQPEPDHPDRGVG